jgi:hypothetical protein
MNAAIRMFPQTSMIYNSNRVSQHPTDSTLKSVSKGSQNTFNFLSFHIDANTGTFMIMQDTHVLHTHTNSSFAKKGIKANNLELFIRTPSGNSSVTVLDPKTFPLSYETDIELNHLKAKVAALEHEKNTAKKTPSTTKVTSATIVEKDEEIKELNAKVKSIQYNMD